MKHEPFHAEWKRRLPALADRLFPPFLILVTGFLCYSSALYGSFQFDDFSSIVENQAIRNPWHIGNIFLFAKTRFLTYLTFAVQYHLHGLNPFFFLLVNLIIHLCAAITLYRLIRLLFTTPEIRNNPLASQERNIALAASLIFVSHPIETQAVAYIVQRATSMASLFYLLSLALFVQARILYDRQDPGHLLAYAFALILALLSMFTKEISLTLPISVLLTEYFFFSPRPGLILRRIRYLWPMLLTLFVIPLTYFLTMRGAIAQIGLAAETRTISRMDYLLTQFNVIRTYLRLLFVPVHQSVDYDYPLVRHFFEPGTFLSFLLIAALIALALILFRKYRLLSFGIIWFFLTLVVESSIFPIRDVIFEHRIYLPSIGIFLSVTLFLFHLLKEKPRLTFALFAVLISATTFAGINRTILWREQVLLWHDAVSRQQITARTLNNLGVGYLRGGSIESAIRHYDNALSLFPSHPRMYFNRAMALHMRGSFEKAIEDYTESIRLYPKYHRTYLYRALAHVAMGWKDKALTDLDRSIELFPGEPVAFYNRSCILFEYSRFEDALRDVDRAIQLEEGNPLYLRHREMILRRLKRPDLQKNGTVK